MLASSGGNRPILGNPAMTRLANDFAKGENHPHRGQLLVGSGGRDWHARRRVSFDGARMTRRTSVQPRPHRPRRAGVGADSRISNPTPATSFAPPLPNTAAPSWWTWTRQPLHTIHPAV